MKKTLLLFFAALFALSVQSQNTSFQVLDEPMASDHRPLIVDLRISK